MGQSFRPYDIELVYPRFDEPLTDLIIDLDHLRRKDLRGSTPSRIFFQLKQIFHILESIGSARIEGNNTTIADYIETKLDNAGSRNQGIREISNMEHAMSFIDSNIKEMGFNRAFISELHKKVVDGLPSPPDGEGDRTPGLYRKNTVSISGSAHKPPDALQIESYMDELFDFVNRRDGPKYDLLKTAITHHRLLWIHPFANGNGRTVRLVTYAMLLKQGFSGAAGDRILNPTSVFCSDRKRYYECLSSADTGERAGVLNWCEYVLRGLKEEIEKIDRLLDYEYLKKEVLFPAIDYSLERRFITDIEAKITKRTVERKVMQASDLDEFFQGKYASERSRQIGRLKEKKMLVPLHEGARQYIISFDNNVLLRGIIKLLGDKGFIPLKE